MSEPQEYTLRWRGRETGPWPVSEINRKLDEHEIGMGHEILCQDKWITLEEFFAAPPKPAAPPPSRAPGPPPPPMPRSAPVPPEKSAPLRLTVSPSKPPEPPQAGAAGGAIVARPRRRLVFAMLGVFFGFAGAHNFYARQWLTGMLQLLLSVATSLMGFGVIASWVWAMVEAVVVRKDGNGVEMI